MTVSSLIWVSSRVFSSRCFSRDCSRIRLRRGEQVVDHGGLAAFVGDQALSRDHTGAVPDRCDQEHPAGSGAGAAQLARSMTAGAKTTNAVIGESGQMRSPKLMVLP
jgi:hypothetical protein